MKLHVTIIAAVLVIFLVVDIVVSFYFYDIAVARNKKEFYKDNKDLEASIEVLTKAQEEDKDLDWAYEQVFEEIVIESYDGLKLNGYYLEAKVPSKKTAILAHGYSSYARAMGSYAKYYYEDLGYNILMPDARGHGKSEGDYIGFGWHDRKDYVRWIEYIIDRVGEDSQIVLHGVSMGGATVLMTSGEELPGNVKAIISDCSYTSVKDELAYQLKRMYKLPPFPLLHSTSLLTRIRAGFYFAEASALKQVSKAKTPILFIHGEEDSFIPVEMVYELYENCSSEKDLFIVPGAGHGVAYNIDKEGYRKKVFDFLSRYVMDNWQVKLKD
ncbi:MAG: alpha/beta hydrolase [Clostridiaceae bacterium]|nr:alpha/beta hydrolase [Clostridiaceae bacterium]